MASDDDCEQVRKIFVGGLNRITDDEGLHNFFLPWGTIVDYTIMRDNQGVSRGFGFVTFEVSEPVDNLMKAKRKGQKFNLDDTDIEIKRAFPKSFNSQAGDKLRDAANRTRKIFVGGIPSTTTEGDLRSYFEKYGGVSEVEILYDKQTSRMRGFAFVTFDDEDAADKVCQVRDHKIKMKHCEVKKAESRSSIKMRQERYGGPPGGIGGGRGGYPPFQNQGGGNMGNQGNMGGFGGGNQDLSGLANGLAALQALGMTGSLLQNLMGGGGNQGQMQGGGMPGNRQGQQGGNFGGNFGNGGGGNGGAGGNNPLALLSSLGNMGGQLNNLGNLSNLLSLAGLASQLQGGGNFGGNQQQQQQGTSSGAEGGEAYRQQQYNASGSQQSTAYGNNGAPAAEDGSYGYGYNYNMGSYTQQQSGYGPMKYQNQGAATTTEKKNFRPY